MRIDLYTKAVLTVIALCLLCIVVQGVRLPSAEAQQEAQSMSVNLAWIGGRPIEVSNTGAICWHKERQVIKNPQLEPVVFVVQSK